MPSPDDGATTPAASPTSTTSRPLSHRGSGFMGKGAPSRRNVAESPKPAVSRKRPTALRSEKPLSALPVPTLTVLPCGNTQP